MAMTALQMLVRPEVDVFRRLSIKRRLNDSSGNYETNWLDVSNYVKTWGSVRSSIDDVQFGMSKPEGVSIVMDNNTGAFDHEGNYNSLWHNYLTRYNTLLRIEAGFIEPNTTTEIPPANLTSSASTSTQFMGVMTDLIVGSDENEVAMSARSLASVLEDVPANKLAVASAGAIGGGQLTASDLIGRMRDVTDGASNFILRNFISTTLWSITATANTLTALDTTTSLDNMNCWDMAQKLAEASNHAVWITKIGGFNFNPKTESASVDFELSGDAFEDTTYGHTIKRLASYYEDINQLYNKVRIKFLEPDEPTSYVTKELSWSVGDFSTNWKYGTRTLLIENRWMNSATASIVASTLHLDLNRITERVELVLKYHPLINIFNRVAINYDHGADGDPRWDIANWDEVNWPEEKGPQFNFNGREYKVIGMAHNLDNFETNVTLRRI